MDENNISIIQIHFLGRAKSTKFVYAPPTGYASEFEPLPNSLAYLYASPPSIQGIRLSPTYEEIYQWGKTDNWYRSYPIFFCASEPDAAPVLVLKMVFHIYDGDSDYVVQRLEGLETESKFYADYLQNLQGTIVPTHYGLWDSEGTDWAGSMRCEIFEYCGEALHGDQSQWDGSSQQNQLIAEAMETIHDWNIVHNQLMDDYIPRHILWRAHDQRPFIIDFVTASLHPCTRTIPLVPMQMVDWSPRKSHLCLELHIVGGFLGYLGQKNGYSQELLDRASQWYSESMLRISEAQEDGLVPMDDELEIMRRQKELLVQWAQDSESAKLPMDAARTPAPSAITSTTASTAHPRI